MISAPSTFWPSTWASTRCSSAPPGSRSYVSTASVVDPFVIHLPIKTSSLCDDWVLSSSATMVTPLTQCVAGAVRIFEQRPPTEVLLLRWRGELHASPAQLTVGRLDVLAVEEHRRVDPALIAI